MSIGVPPDLSSVGFIWDEDTGEEVDKLADLREDGLFGAVVWRVKDHEIGSDGERHPVFVGGTVVFYDDEAVTVVTLAQREEGQAQRMGRKWGKPDARVERIAYKDIVADQNTPATDQQRNKVARHLCLVLGTKKGPLDGWERRLIGYAASLANR